MLSREYEPPKSERWITRANRSFGTTFYIAIAIEAVQLGYPLTLQYLSQGNYKWAAIVGLSTLLCPPVVGMHFYEQYVTRSNHDPIKNSITSPS